MKKFSLTVLAAVLTLAATIPVANAAVATGGFNVNASLTAICTVGSFSGDLNFGLVTAFAAPTNPTAITSTVTCTRGLTGLSAAFDTVAGVTLGSPTSTAPTGSGLLSNGLYYTISGILAAASPGAPATTTSGGGADLRTFTVNGAMVAQPGTCATSATACVATTQVRTLTITY